jgi:hypothetical protein
MNMWVAFVCVGRQRDSAERRCRCVTRNNNHYNTISFLTLLISYIENCYYAHDNYIKSVIFMFR